jgi:hypothetical protein
VIARGFASLRTFGAARVTVCPAAADCLMARIGRLRYAMVRDCALWSAGRGHARCRCGMNPAKSRPWGDTLEEPNVNRPFFAFGALLAALALAMLAVSSTSRSTSVSRQAAVAPAAGADAPAAGSSARPARAARFCGILVVLPAEEPVTIAAADVPCYCPYADEAASWCTGSAFDGQSANASQEVALCPLPRGGSLLAAKESIQPAQHDPALLRDESSRDCRSHYDSAYDVAVYGEVDGLPLASQAVSSHRPAASSCIALGWCDYAELMDEALVVGPQLSTSAESTSSVRSSRVLLDFAASALRRAGLMLQSAADELQHFPEPSRETHLAGEQTDSQR